MFLSEQRRNKKGRYEERGKCNNGGKIQCKEIKVKVDKDRKKTQSKEKDLIKEKKKMRAKLREK